jgi:predicted small lipoprotein YifL
VAKCRRAIHEEGNAMKKMLVIAALAAISACSKPAPAPEAEASAAPEVAAPAAELVAADGKPSFGTFKVTRPDGKVVMDEVKADGTYSTTADGKVIETGKWEQKSPSLYCYTKDEKDAVQQCNEEKVENGVYTSKNPKGEVATVERVEN